MTVKEVKEIFKSNNPADVEVFRSTELPRFSHGFHGDFLDWCEPEDYRENEEVEEYELMDEEEYNNSIQANSCVQFDFDDLYGNKKAKVLVIKLYHIPEYEETEVTSALKNMKRQIEAEDWVIYANDRGSGSAGVHCIDDASVIDNYLRFAETGDNESVPNCSEVSYISSDDFDDEDNEIINEILQDYGKDVSRDEILGLVVCHEHYDMDYTFYMMHIAG